jgi:hypothetical protein
MTGSRDDEAMRTATPSPLARTVAETATEACNEPDGLTALPNPDAAAR